MANDRVANSHYVDTADVLSMSQAIVKGVIVTATAANAVFVLSSADGTKVKLDLRVATSGESRHFDFSNSPIVFSTGIKAHTVTNAIVTVIYA